MNPLFYPVLIPIALGIVCALIPKKVKVIREILTFLGSAGTFGIVIWLFGQKPLEYVINGSIMLRFDDLSGFMLLAVACFGFLVTLYSLRFMFDKARNGSYYASMLWTLGAAAGALLANHLVALMFFWGFLAITLFLLVLTGGEKASQAAKKTLVIVGGSDALILMSVVLIFSVSKSFLISETNIAFTGVAPYFAYVLLALGVFAKIGAVPLHTWVPDASEHAPASASAFLPGSLDKLLGIYLLARLSMNMFESSGAMNLMLLIVGALTVLISVLLGLTQNDAKRMVGYLVITGAGYMVLGFGTGNGVGMAGGMFYMLSSALWTQCLFLTVGSVEFQTGFSRFEELGGLVKSMPLTFIAALVAILSISGIPPFNGFASKWMIYQGLIDMGRAGDKVWILWLVIAMFGSALTLAVGTKFIHSVFLGVPPEKLKPEKIREVSPLMWFPMIVLALLCIVFGIFANEIPLKFFVLPLIPGISYIGFWTPGLATILILLGLGVGFIIYLIGNLKNVREAEAFIGGEKIPASERLTGAGFYETVKDMGLLQKFYGWAEAKWFDIYDQGRNFALGLANTFRKAHTGVFTAYMLWVFVGLMVLLLVLLLGR